MITIFINNLCAFLPQMCIRAAAIVDDAGGAVLTHVGHHIKYISLLACNYERLWTRKMGKCHANEALDFKSLRSHYTP